MYRLGVLASGRGSNLQTLIAAQEEGTLGAEIAVVISDNPGAQALARAQKHGIPHQAISPSFYGTKVEFKRELTGALQKYQVDLVVLAGYMRLIPAELLEAFPDRVINIHPSLLPAFPGLNAQRQAWEYGVKYSGCTVHFVDLGLDSGPVIAQAVVPVFSGDTPQTLADRILVEEHKLYPQVIRWLAEKRVKVDNRRVIIT